MDALVIDISWKYFLGAVGALIAAAYYANGRLAAIEVNYVWLKEIVTELLIDSENQQTKLFNSRPSISLTTKGYHALARSGLRSYIGANRKHLLSQFGNVTNSDPYELQRRAFHLFADLSFDDPVARHLNEFAFANGISTILLRRVGAIYLRDIVAQSD